MEEADKLGSKRQRFYIELKPEQTTIVSWKRLLRDSSIKPDLESESDPSLFPPPGYVCEAQRSFNANNGIEPTHGLIAKGKAFQVDKPTTSYDGLFRHSEELECMNESIFSSNCQPVKRRKKVPKSTRKKVDDLIDDEHAKPDHVKMNTTLKNRKVSQQKQSIKPSGRVGQVHGGSRLKDLVDGIKDEVVGFDIRHQKHQRSNTSNQLQLEHQSNKLINNTVDIDFSPRVSHRDKNGRRELPDLNLPHCPTQAFVSTENN